MKLVVWLIAGAFLCAALAYWFVWSTPGTPVLAVTAQRGAIESYVEDQGITRLPHIYEITMPLQGRVQSITLREGDRVKSGQLVARLDPSDLETHWVEADNTVKRYDKNLEQVDLAVQQADQTVLAREETLKFLQKEFARIQKLFERQTTTESIRNEAELRMIEARTELRKDQLNRNMYLLGRGMLELMQQTEIAKQQQIERDKGRTELRSPVDGVILHRAVANERVLQAGTVLLEIGDPSQMEVEADFLSQDAMEIRVGDRARIEGAAIGPEPIAGVVTRIYPQGFTKVSSLGVEQQRVRVIVAFTPESKQRLVDEDHPLGVDYRVHVKVFTDERSDTIRVPRTSVFRSDDGNWHLFVVRNGVAEVAKVLIGLRNPFEVEITEGLAVGDLVVVTPESGLEAGNRVEPEFPPQN